MRGRVLKFLSLLLLAATARPAAAVENGVLNYPQGIATPFVGLLPPVPGLFYLNQLNYQDNHGLYGPNGQKLPAPFQVQGYADTSRFLISYGETPIPKLFFYQQIILPTVGLNANVFGQHASAVGQANTAVSPFIVGYNIDAKQAFDVGLDVVTNLGTYDSRSPLNVTNNYYTFSPTAIYRYNDPKGLTFALAPRVLFNTKNSFTNYKSATDFIFDFDLSYNLGKLRVGAVGSYATQFGSDHIAGLTLPNTRFESFEVGPSATYDFGPAIVNVNYQIGAYARNGARQNMAILNIAIPIFTNPPAGGPPGAPALPPGARGNTREAASIAAGR